MDPAAVDPAEQLALEALYDGTAGGGWTNNVTGRRPRPSGTGPA